MVPGITPMYYTRLFMYPFILFTVDFWLELGAKDHMSKYVNSNRENGQRTNNWAKIGICKVQISSAKHEKNKPNLK